MSFIEPSSRAIKHEHLVYCNVENLVYLSSG